MIPIRHVDCDKIGFYIPAISVGRKIEHFDATSDTGQPIAQGTLVICRHCKEPVNLDKVNSYYGLV